MKTTTIFQFAAAAALLLAAASCNRNDETVEKSNFPTDKVIRFKVDVAGTRAGYTTDNLTSYFAFVTGPQSKYSYDAHIVKYEGYSSWYSLDISRGSKLVMLWQDNTTPITVAGCAYPGIENDASQNSQYFTLANSYGVQTNQSTEENVKKSDPLYMTAHTVDPQKDLTVDGFVPVTFNHRLSKIQLKITLGTEYNTTGTTTNPIDNVHVKNTQTAFTWKIKTDELTVGTNSINDVIPFALTDLYTAGAGTTTNAAAYYECILVPQTVNSLAVQIKIGDLSLIHI